MAEVIKMPRLSDTMTEGVIAAWHKKVGDVVKKGDVLAEIETDKATMELESYQNGVLLHIGTSDGGKLQVDDLLAILGTAGENISSYLDNKNLVSVTESHLPKESITESPKESVVASTKKSEAQNFDEAVLMPRLSDTMTEGVIAGWIKKVGEKVKKGDVIAEIETDKATMELESYKNGTLLFQGAKAGEKIQVNELLCIIGEEGLDINLIINSIQKGGFEVNNIEGQIENNIPTIVSNKSEIISVDENGRIFASPLAKKIAAEKGIDLKKLKGSGDYGRIVKEDVDNYKSTPNQSSTFINEDAKVKLPKELLPTIGESFDEIPVSQMRKVIAKRLAESLFTAPHFYLTMSINMDASIEARTKINDGAKSKISFNDLVLKATALSLKLHPKINSSWLGDKIRINHHVNIGVAVAVEEGLLVPVVRYADTKSLSQINVEVKDFAQKAKDKKLQPSDWEGSTFTISNLGMFGIDQFTAIINPPDACILAVGGISQEPIVKSGVVVIGNIMKVTLSCDHRLVDGAAGAAFLQTLKSYLEEPIKMLV